MLDDKRPLINKLEDNEDFKLSIERSNITVREHVIVAPRDGFEPDSVKELTFVNLSGGKKLKLRMSGERIWKIKATQADDLQSMTKKKVIRKNLIKLEKPPKDLFSNIVDEDQTGIEIPKPPVQTDAKSNTKVALTIKGGTASVGNNKKESVSQQMSKTDSKKLQSTSKLEKDMYNDSMQVQNQPMAQEDAEESDVVKRFPPKKAYKNPEDESGTHWNCQYLYVSINDECQINRLCLFKNLDDFLDKFEIEPLY